jgi:hypothetical protein
MCTSLRTLQGIYIYPNDKGKTKELNASRSTSTSVEKGNLLEKKTFQSS